MDILFSLFSTMEKILTRSEKFLLCVSLTAMLVLSSTQVILRNVFDSGIEWADVAVRHLVLFLLFFGASLSTKDKRHIQMDVSSKIIPAKWKPIVDLLINGFSAFITVLLAKASYLFMDGERLDGSILFAGIPTWTILTIMPVGFVLISIRFIANLFGDILVLAGKKKFEESHPEIICSIPERSCD